MAVKKKSKVDKFKKAIRKDFDYMKKSVKSWWSSISKDGDKPAKAAKAAKPAKAAGKKVTKSVPKIVKDSTKPATPKYSGSIKKKAKKKMAKKTVMRKATAPAKKKVAKNKRAKIVGNDPRFIYTDEKTVKARDKVLNSLRAYKKKYMAEKDPVKKQRMKNTLRKRIRDSKQSSIFTMRAR